MDENQQNSRTFVLPRPGASENNEIFSENKIDDSPFLNTRFVEKKSIEFNKQYREPPTSYSKINISKYPNNPFIQKGLDFFSIACHLKVMPENSDIKALYEYCLTLNRNFIEDLKNLSVISSEIETASYIFCVVIDEFVLHTPWGGDSFWNQTSLSSSLHGNTFGGDKFFDILESDISIELVEFMYLCISIGFLGKYWIEENRENKIETIREKLFRKLDKPEFSYKLISNIIKPELHWRDQIKVPAPLWFSSLIGASLILGLYLFFSFRLNDKASIVISDIAKIRIPELDRTEISQNIIPRDYHKNLYEFLEYRLEKWLSNNQIEIIKDKEFPVIRISGKFFKSGSAQIDHRYSNIVKEVAKSIDELEGKIEIIGHTDSINISNLKYPSNWHLSKARAFSISKIIRNKNNSIEIKIRGKGSLQPILNNKTAKNREKNRRVEILIDGAMKSH